jgi:hypothetical protein
MTNATSYVAAQQAAANITFNGMKAYLATIDSFEEYRYLSWVLRASNAFVSGSDAASEGKWVFTDGPKKGQSIPLLPWGFEEPDRGTWANCLAFDSWTDGLADVDCNLAGMDFVVEYDRKCFYKDYWLSV